MKPLKPPVPESRLLGIANGLAAAIGYTAANACLRYVSDLDSFFVSTIRAIPTFFVVIPLLILHSQRGKDIWAGKHRVPILIITGVVAQIFGNVGFQGSLHVIGLAVAVPLILGSMIVSGAIIGWLVLGEQIKLQTAVGIGVLLVALTFFSLGANAAQEKATDSLTSVSTTMLIFALVANMAGGVAYAVMGTVMRRSFQQNMLPEFALLVLATVGVCVLGGISLFRVDLNALADISWSDWFAMSAAGLFNAVAFFTLAIALKHLTLVSVHMLNASQAAMALAAGVLLFSEPLSVYLPVGLALTVVGLIIAGSKSTKRDRPQAKMSPVIEHQDERA